jgi:RNA-binding protein YlmH
MVSISDRTEEDALLRARVGDACQLCEMRSCPRFVGFLDEHQQAVARAVLREKGSFEYRFFGGFEDAERTLLGVFPGFLPPDDELFPLSAIGFRYRGAATLSHRDFLGALLATGVKREKIGDIICNNGFTVVFVDSELAPFLAETVTKVGNEGVRAQFPFTEPVTVRREYREYQDTVASPRLDAVLKAILRTSREEAARRITAGTVSCNHMPCEAVAHTVHEGDVLSVRGVGRFLVVTLGPLTKKGRTVMKWYHYI